jgi:hypothetical protein
MQQGTLGHFFKLGIGRLSVVGFRPKELIIHVHSFGSNSVPSGPQSPLTVLDRTYPCKTRSFDFLLFRFVDQRNILRTLCDLGRLSNPRALPVPER